MAKTTDHKIYPDGALAEKKKVFYKLRKLCKLHTFTNFFSFSIRLRLWVILITVCIPALRSCDFLDLVYFQTIIDIERKRS